MNIEQKQNKIIRPTSIYTMSAEEQNQITSELQNLIAGGGLTPSKNDLTQVKTAVKNIADQSAAAIGARAVTALGTITQTTALDTNTNYTATVSGSAAFTLPTPTDTTVENVINILLTVSATTTVNWGVNANSVLTSFTAGKYELRLRYNNSANNWIGEVLKAEATPSHTKCYVSFNENYADQTNNITLTPSYSITSANYVSGENETAFVGVSALKCEQSGYFTLSDPNEALKFTGAFTVKFWGRTISTRALKLFAGGTCELTVDGTGSAYLTGAGVPSNFLGSTDGNPRPTGSMHYIEITRDSNNTIYYFVDGVRYGKVNNISRTVDFSNSTSCLLSQSNTNYYQDLVITDQVGHTANYDVPTAPYVLADNSLADLHDKSLAAKIADLEAEINNLKGVIKGAIMRRMDFANAVALTMSSGTYTMPSDGYLQLNYNTSTAASYSYKLNSKDIYISNIELMPVSKDDVLALNSTQFTGFFIPEKSN